MIFFCLVGKDFASGQFTFEQMDAVGTGDRVHCNGKWITGLSKACVAQANGDTLASEKWVNQLL